MGCEQLGKELSRRNQSHRRGTEAVGDTTGNTEGETPCLSCPPTPTIFYQSFQLPQPTQKLEAREPGNCSSLWYRDGQEKDGDGLRIHWQFMGRIRGGVGGGPVKDLAIVCVCVIRTV